MNPKRPQPTPDPLTGLLKGAGVAVVGVGAVGCIAVLAYIYKFHRNGWSSDPAAWGEFGDFLGGLINPIVGIITVFLVLLSIGIQRKELQSSLRELKQSNEALATQNAAIARQNFEQTFFAWLSTYRDLVSSVNYDGKAGRDALRQLWDSVLGDRPVYTKLTEILPQAACQTAFDSGAVNQADQSKVSEMLLLNWEVAYVHSEHHLDSMFRTLYRLIRWVDEQPTELLHPDQKWHYISIVRAQLSRIEMIYLFYNGFTDRGRKFARYINKYALFDNFDDNEDFGLRFMRQLNEGPFEAEAFNSNQARESLTA